MEDTLMLSCYFQELRVIVVIYVRIEFYKIIKVNTAVIQVCPD